MAPAPLAAISLTSLRRCGSTLRLCLDFGAPDFAVMISSSLDRLRYWRPTSAHGRAWAHAIIANIFGTGNGPMVLNRAGGSIASWRNRSATLRRGGASAGAVHI